MRSILITLTFAGLASAHASVAHSFAGYGFSWYDPACGYACRDALSGAMLSCSTMDHSMGDMMMTMTSPECKANDTAFLTSVAYCMSQHCDDVDVPMSKRQKFWEEQVTGDDDVPPQWGYERSLVEVGSTAPTAVYNASDMSTLNKTVVVAPEDYENQHKFMVNFDFMEALQAKYIFVLLGIALGLPIFFTILPRLPFTSTLLDKLKPYLLYPATIGKYHVNPLPYFLGNPPTIGQSLFIFFFVLLNLVLSSVNYSSTQPHPWGFAKREEILSYIAYRTGHISFALLPLTILFSGRNNFLLWCTNWSYSTFILLHRWIARMFALHAIIHSIALLLITQATGNYIVTDPYWQWGIVATVLTCFMLVLSTLWFRRKSYEIFLILHILLAVFVIAGCWYHIILRWDWNFYMNWLYAAVAVWAFDRFLRFVWVVKNGVRKSVVREVGPDHVRVDIPGVRWVAKPGYVAYAYFPTLIPTQPWQNHPFSITSTALLAHPARSTSSSPSSTPVTKDIPTEKSAVSSVLVQEVQPSTASSTPTTPGVTMIIKKSSGLTKLLQNHANLLTLLDGPYLQNHADAILNCDRVLLIGGGIGIMGLTAWVGHHSNIKLAWSVKDTHRALVEEVAGAFEGVEKEIVVGERLGLEGLLRKEAEVGYGRVGVVVCGPGGMCDEVRALVAALGRHGKTVFELEVDAYSW
ncbi:hypothetical protein HDV00_004867 [Rhizophlyctis rosea]|nr:hypothetical protein HDV00_004867 [Rhizophlyctis rosea]